MSTSYDSGAIGPDATDTSISWSHTCTNAGILLVVAGSDNFNFVNAVTYNGISLTKIGISVQNATNGGWTSVWRLFNPPSGTLTVQVSASSATRLVGTSNSYIDGTSIDNSGSGYTQSLTINSVADNCWTFIALQTDFINPGADSNTTKRQGLNFGLLIGDSNGPKTPPGAVTLGTSTGTDFAGIIVTIAPSSVPFFSSMIPDSVKKKQTVAAY